MSPWLATCSGIAAVLQNSGKMRARRDSERAVCGIAIVEMEPDREKLLEHGLRRSCVVDALFEGGEVEIGGILFGEGKHQVLCQATFQLVPAVLLKAMAWMATASWGDGRWRRVRVRARAVSLTVG